MEGKKKKTNKNKPLIGTIPIRNDVKFSVLAASFPRADTAHPPQPCVQGHLLAEQPELALLLVKCRKALLKTPVVSATAEGLG